MTARSTGRYGCSRRITCAAAGIWLVTSSCAMSPQFAGTMPSSADNRPASAHYSADEGMESARGESLSSSAPIQSTAPSQRAEFQSEGPGPAALPSEALEQGAATFDADRVTFATATMPEPVARGGETATSAELSGQLQVRELFLSDAVASLSMSADLSAAPVEAAGSSLPGSSDSGGTPTVSSATFLPAEPRIELASTTMPASQCPPYSLACAVPVGVYEPHAYPEEYICDGGDREHRVLYTAQGRTGLDTEDTIGEFTDDEGRVCIRPSTRTCIYAPQFAAVRSLSLHQVNLSVDKLAGTHDHRSSVGFRSRLTPGVEEDADQPVGFNSRSRVSGLETDTRGGAVARVQTTARHIKINNVFENELFLAPGALDRTQEAYLGHAVELAAAWTRDLNPVVVAVDAAGEELRTQFHVEEYIGIEERGKGDLKVVKLVDESTAVPGDVLTFTIHYENIGDRGLDNVRIIDNLTPRLELLPDSLQSDREGRFSTEDNHEGSVVLTFELAEPLPGRTSGTLTFQCRVR